MSTPAPGGNTVTMGNILQAYVNSMEGAEIPSLIRTGLNGPEALAKAIRDIATFLISGPVPFPDATNAVAQQYASQIYLAALLVPPTQWDLATFNGAYPNFATIAQAIKGNAPPPPPPPPSNQLVSSCWLSQTTGLTICSQGLGVTAVSATGFTFMGQQYAAKAEVTDPSTGTKYIGVPTQELMGWTLVLYPVSPVS